MEVEGNFADCFSDLNFESSSENEHSSKKTASFAAGGSRNFPPESDFLDCNICLEFVTDPVVTLCGHLYCWPCIYRWLHPTPDDSSRQCPVCKFPISDSSLVPLYGRGHAAKSHGQHLGIPDRPRSGRSLVAVDQQPRRLGSENYPFYVDGLENHRGVLSSTVGVVLCEMAFAMLPSAFNIPPSPYLLPSTGEVIHESPRWRRQEMQVENWLKQLWIFFLCCSFLCLLFF